MTTSKPADHAPQSGLPLAPASNGQARRTPALEIRGLAKRFRATVAVDGVDLDVFPGELVGLIGPNGAGKSTTVKILTGQLLADRGQVRVGGHDVVGDPLAAKRATGYVPQELELYPFLTGRELLELVATIRGLDATTAQAAIDSLLERFRLTPAAHRMTREYSEGMARKLSICAALLGNPPLLVLDESLNGLDPRAAAEVKAVIREELARGTAIVLVSHILDVLERLCTRVVLIDQGRVVKVLDRAALDALSATGTTLETFFIENTGGAS
ncbi:MAG: ABC transporter ATP-binding protein [Deltaproteobacteria bacterium]|nr:ABC transporter ATP-binding protein [Deltaproteobacteria bacterium]